VLEMIVPAREGADTDPKLGLTSEVESTLWIMPGRALLTGSRPVIIARIVVSSPHGMGSFLCREPFG